MPPELVSDSSIRTTLFSFKGRLSRGRFWEYTVLTYIASAALLFIIAVLFFQIAEAERADGNASGHVAISAITIAVLYLFAFQWVQLALLWKRFHDRGRTGWFALLGLVPILGFLWIAVDCYILPGKSSANRYGAIPNRSAMSGFSEVGLVGAGIGVLIVLAVLGRTFVMEPFSIPSGSNEPTIASGDYAAVSRYAYRLGGPTRGDVAVFINPHTGEDYIKRIVGLPGDTVQVNHGIVSINGQPAARSRIGDYTQHIWDERFKRVLDDTRYHYTETLPGGRSHEILGTPASLPEDSMPQDNTQVFKVPAGHFFAIGDNRDNSNDSRLEMGFVPLGNLVGRAEFIYLSRTPGTPDWNLLSFVSGIRWNRMLRVIP